MGLLVAALLGVALGVALGIGLGRPAWPLVPLRRRRGGSLLEAAQLQRWLQAAPNAWLIVDGEDTVQLINARAERLLQLPGALLPRRQPLEQLCDAPQLASVIAAARRLDRPQRLAWCLAGDELDLHALPGTRAWVAVLLLPRPSLAAQVERQERWVSDVAHELKTPLTALLLVGDSLAAQVNSRNVVLVERLQRELLRLQRLVGDLLELSRLENVVPGGAAGRQEAVELPALVQQVWQGLRPLADQRSIRLRLQELPGRTPRRQPGLAPAGGIGATAPAGPPPVQGDASRLHRALLNLLDNAIRYSPDGGSIDVLLEASPGWMRLEVRDRGPGFNDHDLEHLFERFYRGDPSRVRSARGGSGLGLAIVQQIAHSHGGRVLASNHPEGGARLELLLPAG